MNLTDAIARLSSVHSSEGILSLYVSVDPTIAYRRGHELAAAKSALRGVERGLDAARRSDFARESQSALQLLERQWTPESRAMAIFSSQAAKLGEAIPLSVRVPTQAKFDTRPRIAPLARITDENERYSAVALSKDDARLLIVSMGDVEEELEISDTVPGRHEQGGWSQARYQRHHEFHVREHLKRTLDALEHQRAARPFNRLIVGGPVEVTTQFIGILTQPLRDRLIGAVPCPVHAGRDEVLAALAPAVQAHERSEEEALLLRISEAADAGGRGVLGLEATLGALGEGRVHELAVAEGVSMSGRECADCGYLDAGHHDSCPRCATKLEQADDILERAVERVYAQGGRAEIMLGEARENLVARGGLGALLRY